MTDQPDQPPQDQPDQAAAAEEVSPPSPQGQIRYQDPDTARPKPLSVGEQRARQRAAEEEAAKEQAEAEAAERKRKIRKRVMIGGGVTVGVVALVAAYYALKPDQVTAYCTDQNGNVQSDNYCDAGYVNSHGGHVGAGGLIFLPIPGGFGSYHYNYGGTVSNGRVSGGSTVAPPGATIKTNSGSTIQRGGFGVGKSGGKSGGGVGKSGGS